MLPTRLCCAMFGICVPLYSNVLHSMQTCLCQNLKHIISIHTLRRYFYRTLDISSTYSCSQNAKKLTRFRTELNQKQKTIKFQILVFPDTMLCKDENIYNQTTFIAVFSISKQVYPLNQNMKNLLRVACHIVKL